MIFANLRAQGWKWAAIVCAALAVAAVVLWAFSGWRLAASAARADAAEARAETLAGELKAANETLNKERQHAQKMQRIGEQYEQDKADAQAQYERDLAALRAGHLRLRREWTCPTQPAADAGKPEPDGDAELREQGAADIVRLAREADAQIRGLQEVIREDRKIGAEE